MIIHKKQKEKTETVNFISFLKISPKVSILLQVFWLFVLKESGKNFANNARNRQKKSLGGFTDCVHYCKIV